MQNTETQITHQFTNHQQQLLLIAMFYVTHVQIDTWSSNPNDRVISGSTDTIYFNERGLTFTKT